MSEYPEMKRWHTSITSIIIIGVAASIVFFGIVRDLDYQRIQESFKRSVDERYAVFQREIESDLQMLVSSKAIDSISPQFTRSDFKNLVRPLLVRYPGRQGIGWVPRLLDSQRAIYEAKARRGDHPDFMIKERTPQGSVVRAIRRDEYYPVYFIEPFKGNEVALGFNLASNPIRREALLKARDSGYMAASRRITLLPDALTPGRTELYGFLVFEPVYKAGIKTDTVEDRRKNLKGFILGVFRTGDIVERSLSYLKPANIDIVLYESAIRDNEHFLYRHLSQLQSSDRTAAPAAVKDDAFEYSRDLDVAGQKWLIVFAPGPDYIQMNRSPWSWMVLLFGFLTTAGVSVAVRGSTKYAQQLSQMNEGLSRESQERQQVAEALQKSEARLKLQIDRMPIGCIIWDPDGQVISWNPAAEAIFGYEAGEALGRNPYDLIIPAATKPQAETVFKRIIGGETITNAVYKNITKSGRTIICSWSITPLTEDNVRLLGVLSMVQDITAAKRSEELYQILAEKSLAGVFIVQDGKFRFVNKSAIASIGYTEEDILGQDSDVIIYPEDKTMAANMARGMLTGTRTTAYEYRIVSKENQIRWLSQILTTIIYDDRPAILGNALDVTDLKESQTCMEEMKALESSIMSAIPHVVVGFQNDSILFVNDAAEVVFGWKPEELVGNRIDILCHHENECRDLVGHLYAEHENETTSRREVEIHCRHRDGKKIVCRVTSCRISGASGDKIVSIFEDITVKKMSHIQLMQAEKMASIGKLAAGVAHEINNPTAFVSSNLKTLSEYISDMIEVNHQYRTMMGELRALTSGESLPETIREQLQRIEELEAMLKIDLVVEDVVALIAESREGTDRIARIVQDLKNFAHPGEEKQTTFNVNQNIESTLSIVWNELKYKTVVNKDYGDIPQILGYPQQLNQVFMNLLVNAAQAIKEKGEIRISTRVDDSCIEVKISDTGMGIPPENLPKLFDPFFTTKEVGKGTGLGLHVTYNIIEKHGGSISVESTVDVGTTFTLRIPIHVNS